MWSIESLVDIYYKIFPGELKKKQVLEEQKRKEAEKKEKAALLFEYEELFADVQNRISDLRWRAGQLEELAKLVYKTIDSRPFARRANGESAKTVLGLFDVKNFCTYDEIKQNAIECENRIMRMFVIRQKLKLLGIDRGLNEKNGDESVFWI